MSTQPEEIDEVRIEATGGVSDGVATIDVKLGRCQLVLTFPVGEEGSDEADTLYSAFPAAMEQVIIALEEAREAAEGGGE